MPTTNPVPSTDPTDLLFNSGKLDEVVNGTANSFTDRLGVERRTVAGMNADFDAQLADAESDLNIYRADAAASAAEALGYLQTIRATSYGAYASDPATDPLGNPPTVGDEYFNTTANLLKRWNGTTWQASDINTANLAASSGSSLVGYDGGTVQDVLDGVTGPTGAASVGYTPAGTGAVATTVQNKLREMEVSPDDFPGNEKQKIESAIAEAISTRKTVVFPRMYDITGLGSISINKPFSPRWFLRLVGTGGGIKKMDGGYVFTSATTDTMDFKSQNMRFESSTGAGAVLWDANKIVRVYSNNNQYIGWDTIAEANTRYMQQYELIDEHVSGGRGWLVSFKESWGCRFVRINIEDRNYSRDVTIDVASSTLTVSNHGMPNNFVVYITTTGSLPTGLTPAGTTNAGKYYVVNATTNTFQLSATAGGAAITLSGTQSGTHRVYYGDGHGIGNSEDISQLANRDLVVSECVFENNNGTFLRLCGSFATVIEKNYTEAIRGEHVDMQSFTTWPHYGLAIKGNQFSDTNPNKFPILWGKISVSSSKGTGGAVSEGNTSTNNLHSIFSGNTGYIYSEGDYTAAGSIVGGSGNALYFLNNNLISTYDATNGYVTKRGDIQVQTNIKSVTLTAGQYTLVDIPLTSSVRSEDIVSVTTTNWFNLQITVVQVAASGTDTKVSVGVKNLDGSNSITRELRVSVLRMTY